MSPMIIGVALFAGCSLAVFVVLSHMQERQTVRTSLRQIGGYHIENIREKELLGSIGDRVAAPVLQGIVQLGRRFTPVGYVDKTKKKLVISGKPNPEDVDRFLAVRVGTIAAIPVAWFLLLFVAHLKGDMRIAAPGLISLALALGPDAILNRKVEERQDNIRRELPDI